MSENDDELDAAAVGRARATHAPFQYGPEQAVTLIAATLIAFPERATIPAKGCDHVMTVAINNASAVCVLCRSVINEPRGSGLVIGPPKNPAPTAGLVLGPKA